MASSVSEVYELPGDRLLVRGHVDGHVGADGEALLVEALGWASALRNHYPESAYNDDGSLKLKGDVKDRAGTPVGDPVGKPKRMTGKQKLDYCKTLLEEQNPPPVPPPRSKSAPGVKRLSIRG